MLRKSGGAVDGVQRDGATGGQRIGQADGRSNRQPHRLIPGARPSYADPVSAISERYPTRWPRTPFPAAAVQAALADPDRFEITVVAETGSTHQDLLLGPAVPDGLIRVRVAEHQGAGRGRSDRSWVCPPGAGLMFSVRTRLGFVPPGRRGWIGAVLAMAVAGAVRAVTGLTPELKWPNDILLGGAKLAGVLAESADPDVIVGCGVNVSLTADELPRADATSLRLAGSDPVDRAALLAAALTGLADRLEAWRAAGGDIDAAGLGGAYRTGCATLGRRVLIELPGGASVSGTAVDVDADGALVLEPTGPGKSAASGPAQRRFAAGDIVHLR